MTLKHIALSLRDQAGLQWFFGIAQTLFWRSTVGDMLERAERLSFTSDGERITAAHIERWLSWYRQHRYDSDGNAMAIRIDPEVHTHATRGIKRESSYEVEDSDLIRFADMSRHLLAVERRHGLSVRVLAAYYGESGAFWGTQRAGRIVSVYALTDAGRKLVSDLEARDREQKRDLDLRPDERIGTEILAQERQPNDVRRARLSRIDDQAMTILSRAHEVWQEAA
jgi:hypothetical protein